MDTHEYNEFYILLAEMEEAKAKAKAKPKLYAYWFWYIPYEGAITEYVRVIEETEGKATRHFLKHVKGLYDYDRAPCGREDLPEGAKVKAGEIYGRDAFIL